MENKLSIKSTANAKINLHLEVLDKLESGYHNISTIFQSVDLADKLTITIMAAKEIKINVSTGNTIIYGENLASSAAKLFLKKYNKTAEVQINLEKNIPLSAGLAGGSADAASVLLSLNKLFENPFSTKELQYMGLCLGADIPFCMLGGTALAEGLGEQLTPLDYLGDFGVVLIKNHIKSSTSDMYRRLDSRKTIPPHSTEKVISSLKYGGLKEAAGYCKNDFLAISENKVEMEEIISNLKNLGAILAGLSGSGPTVYAIFEKIDESVSKTLKEKYKEIYFCRTTKNGVNFY